MQTDKEYIAIHQHLAQIELSTSSKKCHNLQVGEGGDDTTTRKITSLVYLISCILLADFNNFSEIRDKIMHRIDDDIIT